MSYLVLARKYRPQTFAQVLEQGHVTRTLGNAIAAGRVAHAILFAGPRGTGKTTVARIVAKAMNCPQQSAADPCNQCRSCLDITAGNAVDVYEIDGASNNSVDQVRELRENVKYMPAHSSYKIYIIDEVHMLSTPAFNALLKTLEEPPAHVLFMFATTEPHKIPITILSRCQRFDFRRVRLAAISAHLASICRQEGVEIDAAGLDVIARESGGSVRDGLSLLDQVLTCGQPSIRQAQVLETLGVLDRSRLQGLVQAVLSRDVAAFLETLDEIFDRGHDIKRLFVDLLDCFRDLYVLQTGANPVKLLDLPAADIALLEAQAKQVPASDLQHVLDVLFREESSIRLSSQPKLALEMVFFRILHTRPTVPIDSLISKLDDLRREIGAGSAAPEAASGGLALSPGQAERPQAPPRDEAAAPQTVRKAASDPAAVTDLQDSWRKVTEAISQLHPSLAANLRKCCLRRADPQHVEIVAPGNQFTGSKLRWEKHLGVLRKVCGEVFGRQADVTVAAGADCGLSATGRRERHQAVVQETLNHPLVTEAIEIFNGKLLKVDVLKEVDE